MPTCHFGRPRCVHRTARAAYVVSLIALSGCLERPVVTAEPQTTNVFVDRLDQRAVKKLDLLFVIDNSASMQDKQAFLAKAVPQLLQRLLNPPCVSDTEVVHLQSADEKCPSSYRREFDPLDDIHIGVISSSLGAHGGHFCAPGALGYVDSQNDRAHLLPTLRPGLPSYNDQGFLAWDPKGKKSPPGEHDAARLVQDFQRTVAAAGEDGCGYEATLEAWYRFLIDPSPPLDVVRDGSTSVVREVDEELLRQRAAFLRPDSLVAIIMLSDENDCSIIDHGSGWRVTTPELGMPPATSACATNPSSSCCRSCARAETAPPAGCASLADDPACAKAAAPVHGDKPNLRCFDQKRRFGIDLLYPISRYLRGLQSPTLENRAGIEVPNPLYDQRGGVSPRATSLVFLAGIVGVPWQDVATEASLTGEGLEYLTADELSERQRWSLMLGDSATGVLAEDPLMRESPDPRQGVHPITMESLVAPSSTDPRAHSINGHEYWNADELGSAHDDDLQYACTFPIDPSPCEASDPGCDCSIDYVQRNKPLCNPPSGGPAGTTQYFAKAYPSTRQLDLLRLYGSNSIAASICPKITEGEPASPSFGFNPAVSAIVERLASRLQRCLPRKLKRQDGQVPCRVIEARFDDVCDCSAKPGRKVPDTSSTVSRSVLDELIRTGTCSTDPMESERACERICLCEIEQLNTAACLEDDPPPEDAAGYCYVDEEQGIGNVALVAGCPETERRMLRFVGSDLPASNSTTFIACAGASLAD